MSTLSERLKHAIEDTGVKQVELARTCGVRPPSVADWLTGRTKNIRGAHLVAAAKLLNVNEAWLADGAGPKERLAASSGWPFDLIPPERIAALNKQQNMQLQSAMLASLSFIEEPSPQKNSPKAA